MIDWLRRDPGELAVDIGGQDMPVVLKRHPSARRMTMRLSPDGKEIRITLPRWGRTQDALAFVELRKDWLAQQRATSPDPTPVGPGSTVLFRGETLTIAWQEGSRRRPRISNGQLELGGAEKSLAARIRRWLESEAQALLEDDLAYYCERAGRPAPPLRLSRAQRRWGSCSDNGTIRINWRLVQAPDFVRRSVVAHEVAHLVHFDHSPAFHALLDELFEGEVKAANRWLKSEARTLYTRFG